MALACAPLQESMIRAEGQDMRTRRVSMSSSSSMCTDNDGHIFFAMIASEMHFVGVLCALLEVPISGRWQRRRSANCVACFPCMGAR